MESTHEEKYHGLNIRISQDIDTQSPQEWGDNNVFLVGYHRDFSVDAPRYTLPKEQWTVSDHKSVCTSCGQRNFISVKERGNVCGRCNEASRIDKVFYSNTQSQPMFSKGELTAFFEGDKEGFDVAMFKKYHVFKLEAYIHSGVVLALSREGDFPDRRWDVSQLGAVLVSKEEARTKAKARTIALGLIETWNDYLSGNVYGYQIEDAEGNELESCWGFYGDYDSKGGVLAEAKNVVDSLTNKGTTDHNGQLLMEFVAA
jgi:hypothetical protein